MPLTEDNANHVNATRGVALTCRIPLQEFSIKLQKYKTSLWPFNVRQRGPLKAVGRKSQWAIFMSEEVAGLRAAISAKVCRSRFLEKGVLYASGRCSTKLRTCLVIQEDFATG